jgi:putative transcriptional regulator
MNVPSFNSKSIPLEEMFKIPFHHRGVCASRVDYGHFMGKLLISMPYVNNQMPQKSVIYIGYHSPLGAVGFMINKIVNDLSFSNLVEDLNISYVSPFMKDTAIPMLYGGPMEKERGFVLHSPEYRSNFTMKIDHKISITATISILRSLCYGTGPRNFLLALGYRRWQAGELEEEIMYGNRWLVVDVVDDVIFNTQPHKRWNLAMQHIGIINSTMIYPYMGHG